MAGGAAASAPRRHPPDRAAHDDSAANEGLAFYNEELLLQGLLSDSPHARETIYNFMRLRAIRVEVDVLLAIGEVDVEEAGRRLERLVPMDRATARQEAAFFATSPGQGLSYQIGKLQILRLLADAARIDGDALLLRAFHDVLWKNGNVPIALQRWERLGLRDDVDALDAW